MDTLPIQNLLIVDDDVDFVQRLEAALQEVNDCKYRILWRRTGNDAIRELQANSDTHVVLLEYFLPDQTGLDVVRKMSELRIHKPVIFLTANQDFEIAVEIMRLGVRDYLVKEKFPLNLLAAVITRVYDEYREHEKSISKEITEHRIAAMRRLVDATIHGIEKPTIEMQDIMAEWSMLAVSKPYEKFVNIMKDNAFRIEKKIEKLRSLNTDKTVKYIKDIRMVDLS